MAMMGGMMGNFGMGMGMAAAGAPPSAIAAVTVPSMNVTVSSTTNGVTTTSSGPAVTLSLNTQPAVNAAAAVANAMVSPVVPAMNAAVNAAASMLNAMTSAFPAAVPPPPPAVQVLVNGYSMAPDNSYVVFDIEVRCQFNGGAGSIVAPTKCRYSQLFSMHESISAELGLPLPSFPPKRGGFYLTEPASVEQRMRDLRSYFDAASRIPAFFGASAFLSGLGLQTHPQLASVLTYFKSFVPVRPVMPQGPQMTFGMTGGKTGSCHDTRCKEFMQDVSLPHTHNYSCGTPSCPNFMKNSCPQLSYVAVQNE